MSAILELVRERIDDEYFSAKFGDFKVIMNSKGYINATKLCKLAGKRFDNWLGSKHGAGMIDAFEKGTGSEPGSFVVIILDGNNKTRGTYLHPELIPQVGLLMITPRKFLV